LRFSLRIAAPLSHGCRRPSFAARSDQLFIRRTWLDPVSMSVGARPFFFALFVALALPGAMARQAEPIVPVVVVAVDQGRAALGERLFSDVRLSRTGQYSCATCHPLDEGGMDSRQLAERRGKAPPRNTPTIFNAALNPSFNWDGSAQTLEEHTSAVVATLMDLEWPQLVKRLRGASDYVTEFRAVYGGIITEARVIDAMVSFERTLLTPDAPFDRYLRGDAGAISDAAKEGYRRFKAYGCASCHQGVNAGGNLYQRFGVFEPVGLLPPLTSDPGRLRITGLDRDQQVFRVPSMRNVAITAPYFHDGRAATLDEAVGIMGRHQLGRRLSPDDVEAIVAFLRTLTGEFRGRPLTAAAPSGRGRAQ
jgi:cytochrome c peroxidase